MSRDKLPSPLFEGDWGKQEIDGKPLSWLFKLVKDLLTFDLSNPKAELECPQASFVNPIFNALRQRQGIKNFVDEHDHHPAVEFAEVVNATNIISRKIQEKMKKMPQAEKGPDRHVYGDPNNPDLQVVYTLIHGKWHVEAGKDVNAVIFDPNGQVIEITGGQITKHGQGGMFEVGHHHEHAAEPARGASVSRKPGGQRGQAGRSTATDPELIAQLARARARAGAVPGGSDAQVAEVGPGAAGAAGATVDPAEAEAQRQFREAAIRKLVREQRTSACMECPDDHGAHAAKDARPGFGSSRGPTTAVGVPVTAGERGPGSKANGSNPEALEIKRRREAAREWK